MANDPQDTYVQVLTANLQRTLDFLKFAEAKNAALLALASAWIAATLNLICGGKPIPTGFTISIWVMLVCALCAGILAMVSILPRLHLPSFLGGNLRDHIHLTFSTLVTSALCPSEPLSWICRHATLEPERAIDRNIFTILRYSFGSTVRSRCTRCVSSTGV